MNGMLNIKFNFSLFSIDFRKITIDLPHSYDTETGTWHTIKPMNRKRYGAPAAILNGLIYVVGGYEDRSQSKSSTLVESYDPKTDEWTARIELDEGLSENSLVAFNGMLYAFARGVREYDPVKNVWTKVNESRKFCSRHLTYRQFIFTDSSELSVPLCCRRQRLYVCYNRGWMFWTGDNQ